MILYFNSKITIDSLTSDYTRYDYFYPIVYPKKNINIVTKLKVVKDVLFTYSSLPFSKVIINIDIDEISAEVKAEFKLFVENLFKTNYLVLNFARPSTIESWIEDIEKYEYQIDINEPVLVAMNHDHSFVDYQVNTFLNCVQQVFSKNVSNKYKVLYYSHSSEVCDWILNGRGSAIFNKYNNGLHISNKINNWIDSIVLMSFETLKHIFQSAIYHDEYIGRIDWPNVKYENLNLIGYAYCREFFRHYDGYNHITGMRFIEEYKADEIPRTYFPKDVGINSKLDFYYSTWRMLFLLAIRNRIKKSSFWKKTKKSVLIEIIEISICLFQESYLEQDFENGLINNEEKLLLLNGLRNRIYYFSNSLYSEISIDLEIDSPSYFVQIKNFINEMLLTLKLR
jgi:hypothetical protein